MTPTDQLAEFYKLSPPAPADRFARRLPLKREEAVRAAAAPSLLELLPVGHSVHLPAAQTHVLKRAARGLPGCRVTARKVDANLVRSLVPPERVFSAL